MLFLGGHHGPCILFEEDALALYELDETVVLLDRGTLVRVALLKDCSHAMLMGLVHGCHGHGGVPAQAREDLACTLGVKEGLRGLLLEEVDDRDAVRARHHQCVVGEPDHSGQLELHDLLKEGVDLRVVHQLHTPIIARAGPPYKRGRSSRCESVDRCPGGATLVPPKVGSTPMSSDRVAVVEANLDRYLASARQAGAVLAPGDPVREGSSLTAGRALELFEDQVQSRALDVVARELKREGLGYYTISSAGHEQNGVLGSLLRPTDPCFLHYRSGAFMMARQRQLDGSSPVFDTLLSLVASSEDPVSEGRHKVWGSHDAWTPPQTSTIASHVPKAVGAAFALGRARRLRADEAHLPGPELPRDSIVCCSFGDASVNHATALSGINSARYARRRDNPTPVLFVCEDNQIGISVATPRRWIRDFFSNLPHMRFFEASGSLDDIWETMRLAVHTCRSTQAPVFLHMPCVRLWGHAGTDVESAYLSLEQIEATEALDPLLANARFLVERRVATPESLADLVQDVRGRVRAASREAVERPKLESAEEVMATQAPEAPEEWLRSATGSPDEADRRRVFGARLPEEVTTPTRRTLAAHVNHALHDEMARRDELLVFGEDVGRKGGVYGVTQRLQERFGKARVFDTLLDETTILGVAQGAGLLGMLPVPEISYLAYVHNAVDQLRGEACSLQFFSGGAFSNPMVVRLGAFAYQKGFGGHFHNDDSIGGLRDIPGLVMCTPSRGDDAARLLRGAVAMARESGRVVAFLEPIALYHERDLHEAGDGQWLFDYPPPGGENSAILPGEVGVYHPEAKDLAIFTYANGVRLALRAARTLEERHGLAARVVDLRWLSPLPIDAIDRHASECGGVIVADECRATGGGVAEALVAHLAESGYERRLRSARAKDSYVPLGPAAHTVLMGEEDIVRAALEAAG